MRRIILILFTLIILASPAYASELYVNNIKVPSKVISGTTYAPVRDLGYALGVIVDWSHHDQTVILKNNFIDKTEILEPKIRSKKLSLEINGQEIKTNLIKEDGKVYAPVRSVAENLGALVYWDKEVTNILYPSKVPLKTKENTLKEPYLFDIEIFLNQESKLKGSGIQKDTEVYLRFENNLEIYTDKNDYYYKIKDDWHKSIIPIKGVNPRTYITLLKRASLEDPQTIQLTLGDQEIKYHINQSLELSQMIINSSGLKIKITFK